MIEHIGPYIVSRELGRGGMGVVYLAHDSRLDRQVAIKSIPEHLASDPARLERFEREARTLASLNHPNIAGIYGVEEQDGARYLVLEYVEGSSLAELLDAGPIPFDDAIEYAVQITAGIEAAHESGVIHRDLKPANIMINTEGMVKVLDFGLARSEESQSSTGRFDSPTLTAAQPQHSPTIEGAILGTAAYMSPEQARGRRVDKRTDIWSFGVLLHEMLAGSNPFRGETATDSIGAVLHKDIDLANLSNATPSNVRRVLERCLQRDKKQRYRDIGDVRLDLLAALDPSSNSVSVNRSYWLGGRVVLAAVVFSILGLGAGSLIRGVGPAQTTPTGLSTNQPEIVRFQFPAGLISGPDSPSRMIQSPTARKIAYVGVTPADPEDAPNAICVHDFVSGTTKRLDGTDHARYIAFSPDGSKIAFTWFAPDSDREEYRVVPVDGGPVLSIFADTTGDEFNDSIMIWDGEESLLTMSEDDRYLFRCTISTGELERIGEITGLMNGFYAGAPSMVGDDSFFITVSAFINDNVEYVLFNIDLQTLQAKQILKDAGKGVYVDPGQLLFVRGSTLCIAPYDIKTKEVTGAVTPVASGLLSPTSFSLSKRGDLIVTRGLDQQLATISTFTKGEEPLDLIQIPRDYGGIFDVSDDGRSIVTGFVSRTNVGVPTAHLFEVETGSVRRLDAGTTLSVAEGFAPDGRVLMLRIFGTKHYELVLIDPDGVIDPEPIAPERDGLGEQRGGMISPDGRFVLFEYIPNEPELEQGIYLVDLQTPPDQRQPIPFIVTESIEGGATFTPDGRLIAYQTNASGQTQVVLRAFDPLDLNARQRVLPVSFQGGKSPVWSRDGQQLYFLSDQNDLMEVEVHRQTTNEGEPGGAIVISPPRMIMDAEDFEIKFEFGYQVFDTMPDGRFVYPKLVEQDATDISHDVTLNWLSDIRN